MSKLSRRNFLKLIGAAAPAALLPGLGSILDVSLEPHDPPLPNMIILLFDAMSATNLSVYGYSRQTTTNLERFAARATVYHSHASAGNYTIPGVASLLTGTYPWTNRAINHSGVIARARAGNNIFNALGSGFHRLAFPQSIWSNFILTQFREDIETLLPSGSFGKLDYLTSDFFPDDQNLALRALDDFVFKMEREPASLVFGPLQNALYFRDSAKLPTKGYPRGLPHNVNYPLYFELGELFDGLSSLISNLPTPFFAYLHLFPPHAPYRASSRFDSQFIDGWWPVNKPTHRFSDGSSYAKLTSARRSYDEYIASIDWEFGKLLDAFEQAGVLEDSYVIITSDHGEMFERGEKAHSTPLLYDPVVHVPLLVSAPGQRNRRDVFAPTNAVDMLPTLLHLTGKPIPSWCEGRPLPFLGGVEDHERSTYSMEAKTNSALGPLRKATILLRKGPNKLIYYTGYEAEDSFELYDLSADREEMNDLYPSRPAFARTMKEELLDTLHSVNRPYLE
jgi:hypothetical protein